MFFVVIFCIRIRSCGLGCGRSRIRSQSYDHDNHRDYSYVQNQHHHAELDHIHWHLSCSIIFVANHLSAWFREYVFADKDQFAWALYDSNHFCEARGPCHVMHEFRTEMQVHERLESLCFNNWWQGNVNMNMRDTCLVRSASRICCCSCADWFMKASPQRVPDSPLSMADLLLDISKSDNNQCMAPMHLYIPMQIDASRPQTRISRNYHGFRLGAYCSRGPAGSLCHVRRRFNRDRSMMVLVSFITRLKTVGLPAGMSIDPPFVGSQ